jgi:hypothetical protein
MPVSILRVSFPPGPEIDVTPVPLWRRAVRGAVAALTLAVALPALWLLGTVAIGAVLLATAALLLMAGARHG